MSFILLAVSLLIYWPAVVCIIRANNAPLTYSLSELNRTRYGKPANTVNRLQNLNPISSSEEVIRDKFGPSMSLHSHLLMGRAQVGSRHDFVKTGRSDKLHLHTVIFAPQQRNLDKLEEVLLAVSDPRSSKYGKHLTVEEVQELTHNPQSVTLLLKYFESHNFRILTRTLYDDYISIQGTIQQWENLFKTEFYEYVAAGIDGGEVRFHRALQYSLPHELHSHIRAALNTIQFPDLHYWRRSIERKHQMMRKISQHGADVPVGFRQQRVPVDDTPAAAAAATAAAEQRRTHFLRRGVNDAATADTVAPTGTVRNSTKQWQQYQRNEERKNVRKSQPHGGQKRQRTQGKELQGYITPSVIDRIYNIAASAHDGKNYGSQAVYETIGQTFSPSDLEEFQTFFELRVQAVSEVIGGHSDNHACESNYANDCVEANLDVQYMMAVAQNVPTVYYYWKGQDFLLDWITQVAQMSSPPLVFSISYGIDEWSLSAEYAHEFDIQAMKLGVRGVTILASSGDDGAVTSQAAGNELNCMYSPDFPASSPYVTSVGGTMGPEDDEEEVVCQGDRGGLITSGGGFSSFYATPPWQAAAVDAYLAYVDSGAAGTGDLGVGASDSARRGAPVPGYNRAGRGYPDIAALAHNYVITIHQNLTAVSGTSASSPVFAGMVALVNSQRLAAGKSALGWLNPSLYAIPSQSYVGKDITSGTNNCASEGLVCCAQGFTAAPGWDPITGWGSPDFAKFAAVFSQLGGEGSVHPPNAPSFSPTSGPGQPSPQPVPNPTPAPSSPPTHTPTVGLGWLMIEEFEEEDCEGLPVAVSGLPTGTCLIQYDDDNNPSSSIEYSCDGALVYVTVYSGTHCRARNVVSSEFFGQGCSVAVREGSPYSYDDDGDDDYTVPATSTRLTCEPRASGAAALVPPSPVSDGSYVMFSSYDSLTGCEANTISDYDLYLQHHCYEDAQSGYSYKFQFPVLKVYSHADCHGHAEQETLGTDCEALDDDYGGGGSYSYSANAASRSGARVTGGGNRGVVGEPRGAGHSLKEMLEDAIVRLTQKEETEGGRGRGEGQRAQAEEEEEEEEEGKDEEEGLLDNNQYYYPPSGNTDLHGRWSLVDHDYTRTPTRAPTNYPTKQPTTRSPTPAAAVGIDTARPTASPSSSSRSSSSSHPSEAPSLQPTQPSASFVPSLTPTTGTAVEDSPSAPPSAPPSASPSAATITPVNEDVELDVEQTLQGLTASDFTSGGESVARTFQHVVARALVGIDAQHVTITRVTDVSVITAPSLQQEGFLPLSSENGCKIAYAVTFNTLDAGFSDAAAGYRALADQLQDSLSSGAFDGYLHAYAAVYDASDTLSASVGTPDLNLNPGALSTSYSAETAGAGSVDSEGGSSASTTQNNRTLSLVLTLLIVGAAVIVLLTVCWLAHTRNTPWHRQQMNSKCGRLLCSCCCLGLGHHGEGGASMDSRQRARRMRLRASSYDALSFGGDDSTHSRASTGSTGNSNGDLGGGGEQFDADADDDVVDFSDSLPHDDASAFSLSKLSRLAVASALSAGGRRVKGHGSGNGNGNGGGGGTSGKIAPYDSNVSAIDDNVSANVGSSSRVVAGSMIPGMASAAGGMALGGQRLLRKLAQHTTTATAAPHIPTAGIASNPMHDGPDGSVVDGDAVVEIELSSNMQSSVFNPLALSETSTTNRIGSTAEYVDNDEDVTSTIIFGNHIKGDEEREESFIQKGGI